MIEYNLSVPIPRHLTTAARLNFATDVSCILDVHNFTVWSQARSVVDSDGEVSSTWNGTCSVKDLLPFVLDMELVLADWAVSTPALLNAQGEVRKIERNDARLERDNDLLVRRHLKGGGL